MYYLKNNKLGMTLIEMIISLVILGILMTSTMGMIISSNNIFISTSMASLDRMVGNYVFQTLEKSTRYATHMKIKDHTDEIDSDYKQSFSLGEVINEGQENESGKLYLKTENSDTAINLYSNSFYGNRTIQYKFEKVENSNKHIHITVTVFRDGKARYKRDGIVKCVNLGLLASGVQANVVDDSGVTNPNGFNQTVYFSTNELLISGGEDAWSLEYKVQEYMDGYNAILNEYTNKLISAQKSLSDAIVASATNRQDKANFETLIGNRNLAFFGVSSLLNFTASTPDKNYDTNKSYDANLSAAKAFGDNNLRYQYQCKIYKYLGYSPLETYEYANDVPTTIKDTSVRPNVSYPNPYYGVAVTKEQLYAGFLFKYFATDPSVGIKIEDFPKFDDPKTFFKGSIFSKDGFDEQMVILSYFIEDSSKGVIGKSSAPLATIKSTKVPCTTSNRYVETPTWVTWGSTYLNRFGNNAVSDGVGESYKDDEGVTHNIRRAYTIRSTNGSPSYMKYKFDESLEGEEFVASIQGEDTIFTSGSDTEATWNKIVKKLAPQDIESVATEQSRNLPSAVLKGNGVTGLIDAPTRHYLIAKDDIPEGWYYCYVDGGLLNRGSYGYLMFYLAAPEDNINPDGRSTAVKKGDAIDIYERNYSITSPGNTGVRYQQARYTVDPNAALVSSNADVSTPVYQLYSHNYADFMLYSVDCEYWYISPSKGLLNKAINNAAEQSIQWANLVNGVISAITGGESTEIQSNSLKVLNASNANKSLGNLTSLSLSGTTDSHSRSYNNAFIVYNKNRSTWYYLPSKSNRISERLSGNDRLSFADSPTILNLEGWGSSSNMISDIENRKLSSTAFFGLFDDSSDVLWVALPSTADALLE